MKSEFLFKKDINEESYEQQNDFYKIIEKFTVLLTSIFSA